MGIKLLQGDCRQVLASLPAESVQTCVTSPPYYGLRDYGTAEWAGGDAGCDHLAPFTGGLTSSGLAKYANGLNEDTVKAKMTNRRQQYRDECKDCGAIRVDQQIGLEQSPAEYVAQLVEVFREVRRVLRSDGTVWLNLGDSYASSSKGTGGDGSSSGLRKDGRAEPARISAAKGSIANQTFSARRIDHGMKPKDLMLIPARVAIALQDDGWWIRSEIIWSKSAPMPESVRDRPTCAHEKVWLLTKAATYFYDADAVAEPSEMKPQQRLTPRASHPKGDAGRQKHTQPEGGTAYETRNLRNVWHLNPEPFPGAHFATMPATLAERCIKAGTSERGCCPLCGAPWVRMVETKRTRDGKPLDGGWDIDAGGRRLGATGVGHWRDKTVSTTTGWTPSCSCPEHEPVPQTVLDPFSGAGTTLVVASRLQRNAIGIELNPQYVELARRRIYSDGPLFAGIEPSQPPPVSCGMTGTSQSDWIADSHPLPSETPETVEYDGRGG